MPEPGMLFESLFKYPWSLYTSGEVQLAWPWWVWLTALAVLPLPVWWLAGYRHHDGLPGLRMRTGLTLLRAALLAVVLLLLLRPVLVVPVAASLRPGLLLMLDESLSMGIANTDGRSRAAQLEALLRTGRGGLVDRLAARFDVQRFAYGVDLRRLDEQEWPAFDAVRSDLAAALTALADGAARASPAAVLLVSDGGADGAGLEQALMALRARGVPVHVLGVGEARIAPDAELSSLSLPARVFAGDSVEAQVQIAASGLAGRRARLVLSVDGVARLQRDVDLPGDGTGLRLRLPLEVTAPGVARIEARLQPLPGERLPQNNHALGVVEVAASAPPSLHYEAEPRFEVKFLRRAVSEDEALPLRSLVRTAENKFYRLGVDADDELAEGFPGDAAALFRFGVVILGARAAATLTAAQLVLLDAFVADRGGALVLLEGSHEGARAGAVIERLSPLPAARAGQRAAVVRVRGGVNAAAHPLTAHLLATHAGAARLDTLPALTVVQPAETAKPGASTLLLGDDGGSRPLVVLAWHRYGRGRVVALPVRDTWRWQMHAEVGPHDQTHENFWRQMLRWLARDTPSRLTVHTSPAAVAPGVAVEVRVDARDEAWRAVTDDPPRVLITTPIGDRFELPIQRAASAGEFEGRFVPAVAGAWEMNVLAGEDDDGATATSHWLMVHESGREFHAPALNEARLRRVAAATGGSYRPLEQADELLAVLQSPQDTRGRVQRLPLWDMPALYLLAVLLAVSEWALRRRRGLP